MIINLKSSYLKKIEERKKYEDKWLDWYAWYPVGIDEDYIVWLHTIERRRNYYRDYDMQFDYDYSYRIKERKDLT
jgi:hypothetical protein